MSSLKARMAEIIQAQPGRCNLRGDHARACFRAHGRARAGGLPYRKAYFQRRDGSADSNIVGRNNCEYMLGIF